jgi:hypothetical protein
MRTGLGRRYGIVCAVPMPRLLRRVAPFALLAPLVSCGGDSPAPTPTQPTSPPTVTSLLILSAPTASIGVGQIVHLSVAERLSDGTVRGVNGSSAAWSLSSMGVVTLSNTGVVEARSAGSATISAAYAGRSASVAIRVVANWPADLDLRLAVLDAADAPPSPADLDLVLGLASDLLFERTGARFRVVDRRTVAADTAANIGRTYLDSWTGEQPDSLLVWSTDDTAVGFGGYSTTIARPAPYLNRYPGVGGEGRAHIAVVHFNHKYGRCGYDTRGVTRISDRSGNGECRNRAGLTCVDNGRFWECPDVAANRYAQPHMFTASTVVHELMHPYGTAGNNDHYGTEACRNRIGMTAALASDLDAAQWHCGMCPDVFLRFRPAGVPNISRIRR